MSEQFKANFAFDFRTGDNVLFVRMGEFNLSGVGAQKVDPMCYASPLFNGEQATAFVQAVMDAGYKAGLRPAGYEEPNTALAATREHLADMRKLVFEEKPPITIVDERRRA